MDRNGSLHLLRLGADPSTGIDRYAISYAPYDKGGGALPTRAFAGEDAVIAFLKELRIDDATARRAITQVRQDGRTSLPNVVVSDQELQRHGLQELGILESVLSYLST
jgi:hypothetical protein